MRMLLFLMLALPLTAAENFWQQLETIETTFYGSDRNLSTPVEVNATDFDPKTASLVDAKYEAYNALILTLKNDPYTIEKTAQSFFDSSTVEERLFKFKSKIVINERHGYDLAADRDRIARDTVLLKQHIQMFFLTLATSWTMLDEEAMGTLIQSEMDFLTSIAMANYEAAYLMKRAEGNELLAMAQANLKQARRHYHFYSDFLHYLQLNPQLMTYTSIIQHLDLGTVIHSINNNVFANTVNLWLRYLKTDLGRLTLAVLILLFSWIGSYLIYSRLANRLKKLILKEKNELDDLLLSNVENIRKPLLILIMTFGLELALQVLVYPNPLKDDIAFFYFIYLVTIGYILMMLVNNFFFEYLFKRTETTNKKLRNELLNLIVSVIKAIIVIVVVLLFLSRLGVNITGLVASLGIGGLAVALAAQNTLSNFFGLLKILYDNSFSQGDWIATKDVEGTVVEVGFISTMIRTFDNALITVPNADLANTPLKNWNRRKIGRRIKMHVGVTYGAQREDLEKAIEAIREMLMNHPGIASPDNLQAEPIRLKRERKLVRIEDKYGLKSTLLVYLDQLNDSSIDILIYAFTKSVSWEDWLIVKQDVIFKIWEILDANDLEFAFPSQSI